MAQKAGYRGVDGVIKNLQPHGCGCRAYRDIFTACFKLHYLHTSSYQSTASNSSRGQRGRADTDSSALSPAINLCKPA